MFLIKSGYYFAPNHSTALILTLTRSLAYSRQLRLKVKTANDDDTLLRKQKAPPVKLSAGWLEPRPPLCYFRCIATHANYQFFKNFFPFQFSLQCVLL